MDNNDTINVETSTNIDSEIKKTWYERNKEAHKAYMYEKLKCNECDIEVVRGAFSRHIKTKKHLVNAERYNKIKEHILKDAISNLQGLINK
jgi:hypothetical protein